MNGLGLMGADCGAKLGREGGNRRRRKCEGCQKARKAKDPKAGEPPNVFFETNDRDPRMRAREDRRGRDGGGAPRYSGCTRVDPAAHLRALPPRPRSHVASLLLPFFLLAPSLPSSRSAFSEELRRLVSKTMKQKQKKLRCFGGKEGGRRGDSGRFGKELRNMVIESISIGKYTIEVFCCYY